MLYHLFTTLRELYDLPGLGLFNFVSFRAGMSLLTSLLVGILFGKRIIERLQLKQVGEIVRDLGLEGQMNKQGTPPWADSSSSGPSSSRPCCSRT